MKLNKFATPELMGNAAARCAADTILQVLEQKESVNLVVATGTSQFNTLASLTEYNDIPWDKVNVFHLDEYIGISDQHPASFRKYLNDRFVEKIKGLQNICFINGDSENIETELDRLNNLIEKEEIDLCLAGVGENGHLAFNDPPADFDTQDSYLVVGLNQACRQQQCNEGWFATLEDVPNQAISMSISKIMRSKKIVLSVPGERKAEAIKNTFNQPVSPQYPSTILQTHSNCEVFVDELAASLL